MDYIPSMFQVVDQSIDHLELCQIISNNFPSKDHHDGHQITQIRFDDRHLEARPPTPQEGREDFTNHKRRKTSSSKALGEKEGFDLENPSEKSKKKKKLLHRELEKQRRKEMADLYANLRSLIPPQNLKGKRSVCDQMHVAENYIRELQRKNQDLKSERDQLRKNSNNIISSSSSRKHTCYVKMEDQEAKRRDSGSIIRVRHSRAGIEVVVNTAFELGLPLGRLLRVIAEQGLNVVTCVSAKVNDRFLHTIESEAVSGESSLDLAELEQKLKNLIV